MRAETTDPQAGHVQQLSSWVQWFGPGAVATVAGQTLPGGMLYVGKGLQSPAAAIDPALIDPSLRVDVRSPDRTGTTMDYWPSYSDITPQARAGFLSWLAGGRRDPTAYIGYVFLFFYGLERRVLVDIAADQSLRWELPHLRTEVQRLLDLYGNNGSFRGYGHRLLDVLDLETAQDSLPTRPPALTRELSWGDPPATLKVRLGRFAADEQPLPAAWALAWAWCLPDVHLRGPAHRCTDEFAALFAVRYREAFGEGIVVPKGVSRVKRDYHAASAGLRRVSMTMNDVPDVFTQAGAKRTLVGLIDAVTAELEPFSRFLGRNPEGRASLAGAALLPVEIAGEATGELAAIRDWATGLADTGQLATGVDLLARYPTKSPERMAKSEAVSLAQLLERFQVGVEPDVRLGGPAITPASTVVVFRAGEQPPRIASAAYAAATILLHLAIAVSAADGHVSTDETAAAVAHLERSLGLSPGERLRLQAHLHWLEATGVKLTGLKGRVEVLDAEQRSAMGDLLVVVAAADGVISPQEVTSLTKIFTLLDLDPGEVHTRLHAHLTRTRPAPAAAPVTVRPGGEIDHGYPIHPPTPIIGAETEPAAAVGASRPGKHRGEPAAEVVALDLAAIEAKFAESAAASTLLAQIFLDETQPLPERATDVVQQPGERAAEPSPADVQGATGDDQSHLDPGAESPGAAVAGLDPAHSDLVLALLEQQTWSRGGLEELAARYHLMPDGAIDQINEAALDACDEPLLDEEDDEYVINDYARQELFS